MRAAHRWLASRPVPRRVIAFLLGALVLWGTVGAASQLPAGMLPAAAGEGAPRQVEGTVVRMGATPEPAAGITVRFWRQGREADFVSTTTDSRGVYRITLPDGQWRGAACGSTRGYRPLFWEVTVADGVVTHFLENDRRAPVITGMSPARARPGEPVTLTGSGFGCSGRLLLDIVPISVLNATPPPVTLPDRQRVELSDFIHRDDGQVTFTMPPLPRLTFPGPMFLNLETGATGGANRVTITPGGTMTYVHGTQRSAPHPYAAEAPP